MLHTTIPSIRIKNIALLLLLCLPAVQLLAQTNGVLIDPSGTATKDNSAVLQVSPLQSTSPDVYGGFLGPKVALTATNAATPISSPADGLMVYNTATAGDVTPGYYYWEGSWKRFISNLSGLPTGSGTTDYLARWTGTTTLGIGATRDNGSRVGIGTTPHASYQLQVAGDVLLTSGWLRTTGTAGWYSETYGGGWNMTDATWIRTYNGKSIYQNTGIMRTDGTLQVGGSGATLNVQSGGNFSYRTDVLFANTAGNVGIGTTGPSQKLDVNGVINSASGFRYNNTNQGAGNYLRSDGTNFIPFTIQVSDVPTLNQPTTGQAGSVANSVTFNNGGSGDASGIAYNGSAARTISYNTVGAPSTTGTNATGTWNIALTSFDTRSTATTPESFSKSIRFDFKTNTTNGLSDGGTYNGVMYWRKYGSAADWSGGGATEIAYTDNGNLWHRYGTSTTWGSWYKLLDNNNFASTMLADPSATIGLTAVNGSASTALRSDGAPALSQAITPTWTGTHTFNNGTYSALFTGGNVGIGTASPSQKLEVNGNIQNQGILYQRTNAGQGSGAHGISWYSPAYVTWFDYMAPAGSTNAPNGTAAPTDATAGVTTWARRFNIEDQSTYGWLFESGPNSGVAPTVKFGINSSNGNFHSTGNGYIDGTIRVSGGSPATGKVLQSSDAAGNATWVDASTLTTNYANLTGIPIRTSWVGVHRNFVAEQLSWKNYGNGHTIFDASAGTSPQGTAINNTNPDIAWTGTYPTLMGWNGTNTYGVRVDRAKYAESAPGDNLGNHIATSGIKRNSHSTGFLEGSYNNVGANSTYTNPIYTIGSAYNPTDVALSNMYGIGYSHTNAGFVSGSPGGWGMYVAADGDARIWLGADATGASYFNAGNVGIGITAPVHKLDVQGATGMRIGNSTYDANLVFGNNPTWKSGIRVYDNGQAEMRIWTNRIDGEIVLANGYNGDQSTVLPTDGLWVKNNNLGIGNFSSDGIYGKLHIHQDAGDINLGGSSDPSVNQGENAITWGYRSDNADYYNIKTKYKAYGSYTYSRLQLNWHTGIEIGAASSYGGTRFFNNSPGVGATQIMSIGDGDNHVRVENNLYVGAYGGHNSIPTTYGSLGLLQAKNGYYGLLFGQANSNPNLMYDGSGNGGTYYENYGWRDYTLVADHYTGILTTGPTVPWDVFGAGLYGNGTYRAQVGWYAGSEPTVTPTVSNWGYVGTSGNVWYRSYAYAFVNPSDRHLKHDITPVEENSALEDLVMADIDRIKPSFYKYNSETDSPQSGRENHYRPQMHLGVILDEAPDYIQDEAFSGIDLYGIATLSLAGVKQNRQEIKELKQQMGTAKVSISDFGTVNASSNETQVAFSEDFIGQNRNNVIPVVTLTAINSDAGVYIKDVSSQGFKIVSKTANVDVNWIAMAKADVVSANAKSGSETISPELKDQLHVPSAIKDAQIDYYRNLKLTKDAPDTKPANIEVPK